MKNKCRIVGARYSDSIMSKTDFPKCPECNRDTDKEGEPCPRCQIDIADAVKLTDSIMAYGKSMERAWKRVEISSHSKHRE